MTDKVDQAIAAAAGPGAKMIAVPVQISTTGRPVILTMPDNLTDAELLELTAWLLMPAGLRAFLESQRNLGLVVARSIPIRES